MEPSISFLGLDPVAVMLVLLSSTTRMSVLPLGCHLTFACHIFIYRVDLAGYACPFLFLIFLSFRSFLHSLSTDLLSMQHNKRNMKYKICICMAEIELKILRELSQPHKRFAPKFKRNQEKWFFLGNLHFDFC